jgi:hypothetical protein
MAAVTTKYPPLPGGLRWATLYLDDDGHPTTSEEPLPVGTDNRIGAHLIGCPSPNCGKVKWAKIGDNAAVYCSSCGTQLTRIGGDTDTAGAPVPLTIRVQQAAARRRDHVAGIAHNHARTAQDRATATYNRHQDLLPLVGVSALVVAGTLAAITTHPLYSLAGGVVVVTLAPVARVVAAPLILRKVDAKPLVGTNLKRHLRWFARRENNNPGTLLLGLAGNACLATGGMLTIGGVLGFLPDAALITMGIPAGALLSWSVCRSLAEHLITRRRIAMERARLAAEREAKRLAAEAERLRLEALAAQQPTPATVNEPAHLTAGKQLAEAWKRLADGDVPYGVPVAKSWVVPEDTRPVMASSDDSEGHQIGWEFAIRCQPGAFSNGGLSRASGWLADVLYPSLPKGCVAIVDRPDGAANLASLIVTETMALSQACVWKGPRSIRQEKDGSIWGHEGRTLDGEDVYGRLYAPGQAFGGMVMGTTGGGKTAFALVRALNYLAAGLFVAYHDPKRLVDVGDLVGVIPLGVNDEHRDVIMRSLIAERIRRQSYAASRPYIDRLGRTKCRAGTWDVRRDGPPVVGMFDEFHMNAADKDFVNRFAEQIRLQRSSAMGLDALSQGGGIVDWGGGALRAILKDTSMTVFRMDLSQARLCGYTGTIDPGALPRLPGMYVKADTGSQPIAMRGAYVTTEDVDGCVYDHLFGPDGTPLLTPPELPTETLEVFKTHGLMDLWRLGQGPNGAANLLSDIKTTAPTNPINPGTPKKGEKLPAADVVLVILDATPGGTATDLLRNKHIWSTWGWDTQPALSTITRALESGIKDGSIIRDPQGHHRLTERGSSRAVDLTTNPTTNHEGE